MTSSAIFMSGFKHCGENFLAKSKWVSMNIDIEKMSTAFKEAFPEGIKVGGGGVGGGSSALLKRIGSSSSSWREIRDGFLSRRRI
ncbi:conserved hypothetical protein [Ricinus communis]|uniref:Uncharacterized protein n=1 Tax=Ricinus communis TaxID=3988 RepID=B9RSC0_RICCO|nr:conserved hypothetical protein [Ricinus communis]